MLAYEFLYIWAVRHFDDYDMLEILFFVSFIGTKVLLNLTASFTFATKIGWQFSTSVATKTKWYRAVHLYSTLTRAAWLLDTVALGYFTLFYFQHMGQMKTLVMLQYATLPIFCVVSANMTVVGLTLNSCANLMDTANFEKIVADTTESIL